MANRKRNIQMKFYVTEEEKWLIDGKMAQLPTRRYGAYLRKMAIDGYIIQLDTTDIKRMNAALSAIGRNINQIAKRVNAGGGAYKADMREIQERLDEKRVDGASRRRENAVFSVRGNAAKLGTRQGCVERFSPRQSAQRPQGCISAPLLPRDYSACRFLGSFSQKLPRRFTRQSKSEKGLRVLVRHGDKLRHNAFNKAAPRTKAVVALLALLNGKPAVKHLASVLILPDFLLRAFQLGITFLDGLRYFLLCHCRSFLPIGTKKGGYFGLEIVALWVRYSVYGVLSAL